MGCNCGGSTPRQTRPAQQTSREARMFQRPPARATGGPGQEGYYWNGPEAPAPVDAPADPVAPAEGTPPEPAG